MNDERTPAAKAYYLFVLAVVGLILIVSGSLTIAVKAGWWQPEPLKIGRPRAT